MASGKGSATLNFGAFPGSSHATVAVTGQASILTTSYVEAWIFPATTSDHSQDEHVVETIKVVAAAPTAGVGFTIHGVNTNTLSEPIEALQPASAGSAGVSGIPVVQRIAQGGKGTMLYGQWNVGWVWSD